MMKKFSLVLVMLLVFGVFTGCAEETLVDYNDNEDNTKQEKVLREETATVWDMSGTWYPMSNEWTSSWYEKNDCRAEIGNLEDGMFYLEFYSGDQLFYSGNVEYDEVLGATIEFENPNNPDNSWWNITLDVTADGQVGVRTNGTRLGSKFVKE